MASSPTIDPRYVDLARSKYDASPRGILRFPHERESDIHHLACWFALHDAEAARRGGRRIIDQPIGFQREAHTGLIHLGEAA